jgi:hypothetical protein
MNCRYHLSAGQTNTNGHSMLTRRNVSKRPPSNLIMKHLLALMLIAPLCAQMPEQLEAHGVSVANATYEGKSAVRLDALPDAANGQSYAIVKGSRFRNGTIEVELAGKPAANAGPAARGFIGMAFRLQVNQCRNSNPNQLFA